MLGLFILQAAQEFQNVFYSEKEKMHKELPLVGTGTSPLFRADFDLFYEPYQKPFFALSLFPGVYLEKGRTSLLTRFYIRGELGRNLGTRLTNAPDLAVLTYRTENSGFDEGTQSYIQYNLEQYLPEGAKGHIYVDTFAVSSRYISKVLREVRIGKLWVHFSPYTIYRTWGLDGVMVHLRPKHDFDVVGIYSLGYVSNNGTYIQRKLYAGEAEIFVNKFYLHPNGYKYEVPGLREETAYELHGMFKVSPLMTLKGRYVSKTHSEIAQSLDFESAYYMGGVELKIPYMRFPFAGVTKLSVKYFEMQPNFFPADPATWLRYPPMNSPTYFWIYEEERPNTDNIREVDAHLKTTIWKIMVEGRAYYSQLLDKNQVRPWHLTNPPGLLTRLKLVYVGVGWTTWAFEWWHKSYNDLPDVMFDLLTAELYVPMMESMPTWISLGLIRKQQSETDEDYKFYVRLLSKWRYNKHLSLTFEIKYSIPNQLEKGWLFATPYYWEQSWGIDNFGRFRITYEY